MIRHSLSSILRKGYPINVIQSARFSSEKKGGDKDTPIIDPPSNEPPIPSYPDVHTSEEPLGVKRARLLYQSRKRGMLENDLLLSTFASKHLGKFSDNQLFEYDYLINGVSNDWDLYYWAVGLKPTPSDFDNSVMKLLKVHVKNLNKEPRIRQPDL